MEKKIISIGSDHRGFQLKKILIKALGDQNSIHDCGADSDNRKVDYIDYAKRVVGYVLTEDDLEPEDKVSSFGILICNTGVGMSIAANRYIGIRAALCRDEESAKLSREHNNANILILGSKNTDEKTATIMANAFINTPFLGKRHKLRIQKLDQI